MSTFESIVITCCGKTIRIQTELSNDIYLEKIRKSLFESIKTKLSPFTISAQNIKYDITIQLINFTQERFSQSLTFDKNQKEIYKLFSKVKNKKTIISFSNISIYEFDLLLRASLYYLLDRNSGLFLHSSASLVQEKANIFLGKSGAGKTTSSTILKRKYPALADDCIYVAFNKNKAYLYQTPFLEKQEGITKSKDKIEIKNIFFLKKSTEYKIKPVTDPQKLFRYLIDAELYIGDQGTNGKNIMQLLKKNISFSYLFFGLDANKLLELIEHNQ